MEPRDPVEFRDPMEFRDVVRRRRMVRDFTDEPVLPSVVDELLDLATRAPSAGHSQGWSFVVLEGPAQTARFWDTTLPADKRVSFPWPGLLRAPVLIIPLAEPQVYVDRYAEPDKARTGLGEGEERWPVPYWYVDTAFASMLVLLGAVDADLGALFFGIFSHEDELLAELGVPEGRRPVGAIALGHPAADQRPSASTRRGRAPLDQVIHRNGW